MGRPYSYDYHAFLPRCAGLAFAFRETDRQKASAWFPYGFVRLDSEITLFNYIGKAERAEFSSGKGVFVVQTHFGEEPMDFRIASIHPFKIERAEIAPAGLPMVRFWHPRPQ